MGLDSYRISDAQCARAKNTSVSEPLRFSCQATHTEQNRLVATVGLWSAMPSLPARVLSASGGSKASRSPVSTRLAF